MRAKVLDYAVEQVRRGGLEALSVAAIARALKVSTAAPYKHFPNRAALVHAVGAHGMQDLGKAMAEAAQPKNGSERVVAIGKAYLSFARKEPNLFATMFGEAMTDLKTIEADALRSAGHDTFAVLRKEVAIVLDVDFDAPIAGETAYALWSMVHGQSVLALDNRDAVVGDVINTEKVMRQMTLRILVAGPQ
ncbi:hypothetical protein KIN_40810 [Litoreibacter roseus]|uniref:HTH tetR-type domain-containing protein n=2 Tax=Litoreibacter roseus TaxID=2601869 RepID=A0A6N6JM14_9RHOB|nr:hypothetical protein KIN_40810 [Litoreibacter roseus]